jgi:hypothetical protein
MKSADLPPQGSIIEYPYLWLSQAADGETEGRKERPVCLALKVLEQNRGEHHLVLLAVSSQPPRNDQNAVEVPDIERRRANLTRYAAAWVYTSEFNYDISERSFYFDPGAAPIGVFSPGFVKVLALHLRRTLQTQQGRVNRDR